jgi:hypothetical protein
MKSILLTLMLMLSGFGWSQSLCLYQDSLGVIVCSYYSNSGAPTQGDCAAEARASNPTCGWNRLNNDPGGCATQIWGDPNRCLSTVPPYNLITVNPMNENNCINAGGRWCPSDYYGFYTGAGGACGDLICANAEILLPVSLISFEGELKNNSNYITWTTGSESNNDYYIILNSIDGITWNSLVHIPGAGNSTQTLSYRFIHGDPNPTINYYKLIQVDYDGKQTQYGPISIDNRGNKRTLIKTVNMMGQEVNENYRGLLINIYSDGTREKIYK